MTTFTFVISDTFVTSAGPTNGSVMVFTLAQQNQGVIGLL